MKYIAVYIYIKSVGLFVVVCGDDKNNVKTFFE